MEHQDKGDFLGGKHRDSTQYQSANYSHVIEKHSDRTQNATTQANKVGFEKGETFQKGGDLCQSVLFDF